MAALYIYQQSRGGIIDVEAEESKLVLVTGDPSLEEDDISNDHSVSKIHKLLLDL